MGLCRKTRFHISWLQRGKVHCRISQVDGYVIQLCVPCLVTRPLRHTSLPGVMSSGDLVWENCFDEPLSTLVSYVFCESLFARVASPQGSYLTRSRTVSPSFRSDDQRASGTCKKFARAIR